MLYIINKIAQIVYYIGRSEGLDQAITWHLEQRLVFITLKNGNYKSVI
jgi:hypothetical protein